jgi:hypothetical protein
MIPFGATEIDWLISATVKGMAKVGAMGMKARIVAVMNEVNLIVKT